MRGDVHIDQLRKLWILNLIVQTGSLRQAALQAKVSPSAISQSLTALERHLGKPLLLREKGSVTPTREALELLELIRPAFVALEQLRKDPAPAMTHLKFGTYESIAIRLLPGLIRRLRERLPRLKLGVRISRSSQLLSMVRKGELCSALITEVDDLQRFYTQEVGRDTLGFYVSRRHPIAALGWRAASQHGVGSLTPTKDGHPRYFQRFLRQLQGDAPTLLSDSFETLRAAAAAGVMVGVLPKRVALRDDDLLEVFPGDRKPPEPLGEHRILMVGDSRCDREEIDFLAAETRALL